MIVDQAKLKEILDECKKISDDIDETLVDDNASDSTKFYFVGYKLSALDEKLQEIEDLNEIVKQ